TYLSNGYDANGRVIGQVQADGSTFGLAYVTPVPLPTSPPTYRHGPEREAPADHLAAREPDAGRLLTADASRASGQQPPGTIPERVVTDPGGMARRAVLGPLGYGARGVLAGGPPDEQTIVYERQAGTTLVLAAVDPLGRRTAYTYDALGNVTSVTRLANTQE